MNSINKDNYQSQIKHKGENIPVNSILYLGCFALWESKDTHIVKKDDAYYLCNFFDELGGLFGSGSYITFHRCVRIYITKTKGYYISFNNQRFYINDYIDRTMKGMSQCA